jgi:putative ABC transport system substrate-binding protein
MIRRRQFITVLGGAAAWPLAARAQQGDLVRRIGVLIPADENDPRAKSQVSALTQALTGLGWTDGRNLRMDLRWWGDDINRLRRSRGSWSARDSTSSWQTRPWRPLPSSGRLRFLQ